MFPWLTVLALLPMLGALVLCFVKGDPGRMAGFIFSIATLVLGVYVFIIAFGGNDLAEQVAWIKPLGAWYAMRADGMAAVMMLLTVIVVPVVLLAEWNVGEKAANGVPGQKTWSTRTYFALALALESLSLFVFLADDVLLFYLMFEATLIPMYFLIAGWGGPKRTAAAVKFLIFSLAGGLIMLVSIIGLYAVSAGAGKASYLISDLAALDISGTTGRWLFVGFLIAFAIKAPMVGVHSWLPDTAEQATPGSSTLLVGILDKIGTFGMIKLCLGLFPEASHWATPFMLIWALVSIVYGAIMAIGAKDLLRLVSYTSISHFGFMVLGVFAMTTQSMTGTIFYMLNHGFGTAALFLVLGFLISRRGAQTWDAFGGVQKVAPVLAGSLLLAGLAGLGLPGMASFWGEFMVTSGTWQRYPIHAAIAILGVVLAAVYILLMYQRTMTGPVTDQVAEHVRDDLSGREKLVVAPVIALLLVFGFFPKPMVDVIEPTVKDTMTQIGVADPEPKLGR